MKFAKNVQLLSKTRNPNNRLSFPPLPSQCWLNGTFCPQICRDWREDKIFGAKPQKFGADGAFLENFEQIFEKLWLRNAIKAIFLDFQKIPDTPNETSTKRVFRGLEKNFPP